MRGLLICLAILLAGCHSDPRRQWELQRKGITLAQDGMVDLHKAGILSTDTFRFADPWIRSARVENTRAYFYLRTDEEQAVQIMKEAEELLRRAENMTTSPSTEP